MFRNSGLSTMHAPLSIVFLYKMYIVRCPSQFRISLRASYPLAASQVLEELLANLSCYIGKRPLLPPFPDPRTPGRRDPSRHFLCTEATLTTNGLKHLPSSSYTRLRHKTSDTHLFDGRITGTGKRIELRSKASRQAEWCSMMRQLSGIVFC